jgi:hypothetical protein
VPSRKLGRSVRYRVSKGDSGFDRLAKDGFAPFASSDESLKRRTVSPKLRQPRVIRLARRAELPSVVYCNDVLLGHSNVVEGLDHDPLEMELGTSRRVFLLDESRSGHPIFALTPKCASLRETPDGRMDTSGFDVG